MLWIALHLPQLPLEVHTRAGERLAPAIVATQEGREARVLCANAQAARAGIFEGLPISAAHALVAGLRVYRRDTDAEGTALEKLATLGITFTPVVSLAPPQTVLLEVEGSLKLFGGAERLLQRLNAEVRRLGYGCMLAAAPTPLAAQWLARAGRTIVVRDLPALRSVLYPLPLSALDLPEQTQAALRDIGVRALRDLLRLPRAGLARRFGTELVDNLDRALGQRSDPRRYFEPPEQFRSVLHFPEPVTDAEALLFSARRQLLELSAFLQARCAGVREVSWQLHHWRKPPGTIRIEGVQVHRNARRFLDLLREHLQRQPLAGAVETIELAAGTLEPYAPETAPLLPGAARDHHHDRALLIERLHARLGAEVVHGLELAADHRPEFAFRRCAPGRVGRASSFTKNPRPLWLLPTPTPLAAHGAKPQWQGTLTLESGPERIEGGWWDDRPVARDYFIARNPGGAKLWIYRERPGVSPPQTSTSPSTDATTAGKPRPRWFLHGLFS